MYTRDILHLFLGHNFVSNLRALKPKKFKNLKAFKLLSKEPRFFQPWWKTGPTHVIVRIHL